MRNIIESIIGGLVMAAFVVTMMMPFGDEPKRVIHYQQVHVMEPWEDLVSIAQKYFDEQKAYESLPQFIGAIRMANGMDHVYRAGDRLIIPMSRVVENEQK